MKIVSQDAKKTIKDLLKFIDNKDVSSDNQYAYLLGVMTTTLSFLLECNYNFIDLNDLDLNDTKNEEEK